MHRQARSAWHVALLVLIRAVAALSVLLAMTVSPPARASYVADGRYTVVDVLDGESIRVRAADGSAWTVRYVGVDAPELAHPVRGADCWATEATARNRELVLGASVYLERDISDVDRFGRLLRHVWLGEQLVSALLVEEGQARAYPLRPDLRYADRLARADETAGEEARGQWGACPVASGLSDLDEPERAVHGVEYGANIFVYDEPETTARDLAKLHGAGLTWQKTLFQWRWIEIEKGVFNWVESDRVVRTSNEAGIKIVARLNAQPGWARLDGAVDGPPDRYQDYADWVGAFVDRYKPGSPYGTVAAVQFWNEPNLTREWGMQPINRASAEDYVHLLCLAHQAAKRASPTTITISAALSPTGTRTTAAMDDTIYLQWMYDAGASGCFDVLGAHGAGYKAPPWASPEEIATTPEWGFHPSFGFRRVEQLRDLMVRNGDADKQVWLTEFGWTSDPINPSYAWHRVSEEEKARYVVEAFRWANRNWQPWIGVMLVWNIAGPGWSPDDERYWWSITNPDGTNRPAFDALVAARATGYLP